jgi:hypothetical protein
MYAAGESPMKAVTSSLTAAMRSPNVVLMISRRRVFSLDGLFICDRQFRACITRLIPIKAKSSGYAASVSGVCFIEMLNL